MNNFNFKSLAFSGMAIASALILFKTVTTYGEKHLHAPQLISKSYVLKLAGNLPNCAQPKPLMLNMEQSGVYFNASLLPESTIAATAKQLLLSGKLKNNQLSLSGKVDKAILCNLSPTQNVGMNSVVIQMPIDQASIDGKLTVDGILPTLGFTALAQTQEKASPKSPGH